MWRWYHAQWEPEFYFDNKYLLVMNYLQSSPTWHFKSIGPSRRMRQNELLVLVKRARSKVWTLWQSENQTTLSTGPVVPYRLSFPRHSGRCEISHSVCRTPGQAGRWWRHKSPCILRCATARHYRGTTVKIIPSCVFWTTEMIFKREFNVIGLEWCGGESLLTVLLENIWFKHFWNRYTRKTSHI